MLLPQINNLQVHLDSDKEIYTDTNATIVATNGDEVRAWKDLVSGKTFTSDSSTTYMPKARNRRFTFNNGGQSLKAGNDIITTGKNGLNFDVGNSDYQNSGQRIYKYDTDLNINKNETTVFACIEGGSRGSSYYFPLYALALHSASTERFALKVGLIPALIDGIYYLKPHVIYQVTDTGQYSVGGSDTTTLVYSGKLVVLAFRGKTYYNNPPMTNFAHNLEVYIDGSLADSEDYTSGSEEKPDVDGPTTVGHLLTYDNGWEISTNGASGGCVYTVLYWDKWLTDSEMNDAASYVDLKYGTKWSEL